MIRRASFFTFTIYGDLALKSSAIVGYQKNAYVEFAEGF